jgi:hypothetical protein
MLSFSTCFPHHFAKCFNIYKNVGPTILPSSLSAVQAGQPRRWVRPAASAAAGHGGSRRARPWLAAREAQRAPRGGDAELDARQGQPGDAEPRRRRCGVARASGATEEVRGRPMPAAAEPTGGGYGACRGGGAGYQEEEGVWGERERVSVRGGSNVRG